jgi:hypothetical protein
MVCSPIIYADFWLIPCWNLAENPQFSASIQPAVRALIAA